MKNSGTEKNKYCTVYKLKKCERICGSTMEKWKETSDFEK